VPKSPPPGTAERICSACGKPFETRSGHRKQRRCATCGQALTPREQQIVVLVAQGRLNKEIAWDVGVKAGTVKEYMSKIFRKTGCRNRTEVAMWWLQLNPTGVA
jgi:DNA-binding NarL/FixJ family response regulator